jgi:hypothetical protein
MEEEEEDDDVVEDVVEVVLVGEVVGETEDVERVITDDVVGVAVVEDGSGNRGGIESIGVVTGILSIPPKREPKGSARTCLSTIDKCRPYIMIILKQRM